MTYELSCRIRIGEVVFTGVHDVVIRESIHSLVQTAVIRLPLSARLHNDSEAKPVQSHTVFNVGDGVSIELGYNGILQPEFNGYVSRISYGMPMTIECEDHMHIVRKNHITHSQTDMPLKDIVDMCLKGLYGTHGEIPGVVINEFSAANDSAVSILQSIRNDYGLGLFFTPDAKLYCGKLYAYSSGEVRYNFHRNINPARNELKWQTEEEVKLKIIAKSWRKQGGLLEESMGDDDGQVRTLWFYNIEDPAELKERAADEMTKYKFTGYTGYFNTLLIPQAHPGMTAIITDPDFPERGGSYYIESVETRFGVSGASRKIEPGIKLG